MAVVLLLLGTIIVFNFVYAAGDPEQDKAAIKKAMNKIDEILPSETVKNANVNSLVGNALSVGMGIIGSVSLIVFLYSGIMWMTSGGDATKVGKAQQSMIWGAIGLFVIFISYIIVKYLIEGLSLWQG